MANKVIRDGKVAVLIAPKYGCGWASEVYEKELREAMLFCPTLVEMILNNVSHEELQIAADEFFDSVYVPEDLTVKWVDQGTKFRISEYDGSESIVIFDENDYTTA